MTDTALVKFQKLKNLDKYSRSKDFTVPYNGTDITLITHKQASLKLAQVKYFLMDISSFLHLSKTVWILGNPEENTGFISQPKSEILKYVSSLTQFPGVSCYTSSWKWLNITIATLSSLLEQTHTHFDGRWHAPKLLGFQ